MNDRQKSGRASAWPEPEALLPDTAQADALDRLVRSVARALRAPVAMVNLVEEERVACRSCFVRSAWYAPPGEVRLSDTFCQHVVEQRAPYRVENVSPLRAFASSRWARQVGIRSYLGVPLLTPAGEVCGALCVADFEPRSWSEGDVQSLEDLAPAAAGLVLPGTGWHQAPGSAAARAGADAMLHSICDPFFAFDRDWRFSFLNRAAEEHLGRTERELLGQRLPDVLPGRLDPRLVDAIHETLETGAPSCLELESRARPGVWFHYRAHPIPQGVALYAKDITERRRAERELRESDERFRQLAETIDEVFWLAELGGNEPQGVRYLYLSPAFERIFGRPRDAVVRNPWSALEFVLPEHHAPLLAAWQQACGGEAASLEYEITRPGGERRWLRTRMFPVESATEVVRRVAGLTADITEEKRAEDSLRVRERQLAEAQRMARLGSWEWDVRQDRVRWSDELRTIFGLGAEEEVGSYDEYLDRSHPGDRDRIADIIGNVLRAGKAFEFEHRIVRPNGTVRVLLCRGGVALNGQGEVVRMMGTAQDVTEQRDAERSLRAAMAKAEQANRAKSEFLSRMSHELRTPLNAILGFGQLLEYAPLEGEDRESVEHILRGGRHLLGLIDEVLDLARIEAGRVTLTLEAVPVAEVVEECLELVRPLAAEPGVSLRLGQGFAPGVLARADQQRLKQVLLNLLSNAIKYNGEGGSVELSCRPAAAEMLRIEVRDTGVGMTPEQLERLFTPFERVGAERTRVQGTGLGLALSKGLVESMGGQLGVESTPGEGSTFWVELPRATKPAAGDAEAESAPARPSAGGVVTRRVLYVEDNLHNLRLVERILARRPGFEVIPAMQGSLGLELAREHRPDLVLLDVQLPDISGEEVLFRLRQDPLLREIPVVAVSADATQQQIERMLAVGAQAYLTKPLDVTEFLSTVDDVLARAG